MSSDMIAGIILGFGFGLIFSAIVFTYGNDLNWRDDLVRRGIARYNERTGKWEYMPQFQKDNEKIQP